MAPDMDADQVRTQLRSEVLDRWAAQRDAMVDADADALGAELAEGFTLTHMTGYVQSRGDWLDDVASGEMTYHAIRDMDVSVDDADPPVLTVRTRTDATIWGSRGTWRLQLEIHFARVHEGWQATHTVASTW